jgi:hypothetical protein
MSFCLFLRSSRKKSNPDMNSSSYYLFISTFRVARLSIYFEGIAVAYGFGVVFLPANANISSSSSPSLQSSKRAAALVFFFGLAAVVPPKPPPNPPNPKSSDCADKFTSSFVIA